MYKLKPLKYTFSEIEPYIDTHSLALHYEKLAKNYLNKLNNLLMKNNYNYKYPIEEIPKYINEFNENDRENILFNLGGVINHELYFNSISPNKTRPNIYLKLAILNTFVSYQNFLDKFKEKSLSLKGSGYTFLVLNNNKLEIINLSNQDTPYNYNLIPLIALDLWEHAYYINYENKRNLYIDNFFDILDFEYANKIFNNNYDDN